MLTLSQFKSLDEEKKRKALEMILFPLLGNDPGNNELLERVILQTTPAELDEFYEVLSDPSKTQSYITKKTKEMEENNKKLLRLDQLLQMKYLKAREYFVDRDNEKEMEEILDTI